MRFPPSKIYFKLPFFILAFAFILFVALLFCFNYYGSASPGLAPVAPPIILLPVPKSIHQRVAAGLPKRLTIPQISIDSDIKYVGLTADGAMDQPSGPEEVAWFDIGPRPGEKGSAVIAGHYDWKNGRPAVFANLHKLLRGDKIYVEDESGTVSVFIVRKTMIYGKDADAADVFGSNDGKAHLNLVTCAGVWDEAKKTFSDRLIVFADEESEDDGQRALP